MKAKILAILAVLILSTYPVMALGGNSGSPVTIAIKYTSGSTTDFTVTLCGTQTGLNFTGNRDSRNKEADCQDRATNVWWANITNGGASVTQTFNMYTGDVIGSYGGQTWVKPDNSTPSASPRLILGAAPGGSLTNYTNVPAGESRKVFAYANYSSTMPEGNTADTFTVSTALI